MAPEIEERLHQLRQGPVEVSHVLSGVDPTPLWERGKRLQRNRRIAAVVGCTAAVAGSIGVGAAALTWGPGTQSIQPASVSGTAVLPDRVAIPQGTLPSYGTDPAVAVALKGKDTAVLVSATDASYGQARLEHLASSEISLSPTGRYLAYWVSGELTGPGQPIPAEKGFPAAGGLAVRDLSTGTVTTTAMPTKQGLGNLELGWAGDEQLAFRSSQSFTLSNGDVADEINDESWRGTWTMGQSAVRQEEPFNRGVSIGSLRAGEHLSLDQTDATLTTLSSGAAQKHGYRNLGATQRQVEQGYLPFVDQAFAADGRVAAVRQPADGIHTGVAQVYTTQLGQGALTWTKVPLGERKAMIEPIGWRGPDILATEQAENKDQYGHPQVVSINPATGKITTLMRTDDDTWTVSRELAETATVVPGLDAEAETVEAARTRWTVAGGGAAATLALVGGATLVWRRRVRA